MLLTLTTTATRPATQPLTPMPVLKAPTAMPVLKAPTPMPVLKAPTAPPMPVLKRPTAPIAPATGRPFHPAPNPTRPLGPIAPAVPGQTVVISGAAGPIGIVNRDTYSGTGRPTTGGPVLHGTSPSPFDIQISEAFHTFGLSW